MSSIVGKCAMAVQSSSFTRTTSSVIITTYFF